MTVRICDICAKPIEDHEPAQAGIDGELVHMTCVETVDTDEQEDSE